MLSRRSFLVALTAQSVLQSNVLTQFPKITNAKIANETDASNFIVLGGWVFLRSDFLEKEG